jgi:hypothetical protein
MDPFTVLVRDGSHIFREKIQVGLQEMEFHGVGKIATPRFLRKCVIFYFPKKVAAYVFERVPGSFLGTIQLIFKVGA